MPNIQTLPGNGGMTTAAAQTILSRVFIIRTDSANFGPAAGETSAVQLRTQLTVPVNSLGRLYFSVFQYPQYNRGDVTYRARTNLEWRPVFLAPPDTHLAVTGLLSGDWVPASSPLLMLPGVPVTTSFPCAGWYMASIEVRAGAAGAGQGEDKVIFTISGSM